MDTTEELTGQWAVVTGASRNIGAATARELAARGANVIICARNAAPLEATASSIIADTGREVVPIVADVATGAGRDRLLEAARQTGSFVSILVNNAYYHGSTADLDVLDIGDDVWRRAIDVNLMAPYDLCRRFGTVMIENGHGSIVNIVAGPGLLPTRGWAPYGVTTAGLWMLTRYLAAECAPAVRVNAVCPGTIAEPGEYRSYAREELIPTVPMGRGGTAQEVVGAIAYLVSAGASYTSGALITVNGGRTW